jgi:hypothetical protein
MKRINQIFEKLDGAARKTVLSTTKLSAHPVRQLSARFGLSLMLCGAAFGQVPDCYRNVGTGQAPGVADTASDPIWTISDKNGVDLGPAVPIGNPVWGAAPAGLRWINTKPGASSGGLYPAGDYIYNVNLGYGQGGELSFAVKADNAVSVYLNKVLLLNWGDTNGILSTGWASFSPVQSVTLNPNGNDNVLTMVVHNYLYNNQDSYSGVLLQGQVSCGNPALIQSTFGVRGNFEVVAPHRGGGIGHYYRDNDQPSTPWSFTTVFGLPATFGAVSMIQSTDGNLQVVARTGGQLVHFWRDTSGTWNGPIPIASGVSGTPSFVQSKSGNFEVVTPLAAGGMARYTRVGTTWTITDKLFAPGYVVWDVSLIESSYGNLEVTARIGAQLDHFWRDSGSGIWHENGFFALGVSGSPSLIQGPSFGSTPGNFEVVTPLATGGLAHYYRDNSNSSQPWVGPTAQFGYQYFLFDGAALIRSNYGNLEVVASQSFSLYHYYYLGQWSGPTFI